MEPGFILNVRRIRSWFCYLQVDAVVLLFLVDLLVLTSVNSTVRLLKHVVMNRSIMQSYRTGSDCRRQNKTTHKHIKHMNNLHRDSELHKHASNISWKLHELLHVFCRTLQ